ncbi:hypothetical protein [Janthinobacterium fluminis]|uniref:Uncharacterized protein n=1 Tax=Janthinobacterium fluminis TaxID=2987524 RepID=A0ABT5JVF4_9BURK|nr:hypothetical protein [Janthinobacterium fluminis]MDC8756554.1 hypothetical protein [Janthinobacterium fluminis]
MALFNWPAQRAADSAALGAHAGVIALRLGDGDSVPEGGVLVIFDAANQARRRTAARVALARGERAWCFHPGPYSVDLTPFAAAPELGLSLQFVIDAADPRVALQRFDLFLLSEADGEPRLALARFGAALQAALQLELSQGNLELPPCTSLDEWHAFRGGLNQLLYTRFGVTVEDCLPADLGERVDFAAMLRARAQPAAVAPAPVPAGAAAPQPPAGDAQSLRRLFLELPAATSALRLLALPPGQALFLAHGALLQRLDLAGAGVATMPSLEWAAPGQRLAAAQQARRTAASAAAAHALDEGWALLARLQLAAPAQLPALLDEADRILSNLQHCLDMRRAPFAALQQDERKEPS